MDTKKDNNKKQRTEAQKLAFEKARGARRNHGESAQEFRYQLFEEACESWARSGHLSDDDGNPYD